MEIKSCFRYFVILASLIIFCYQLYTALNHLLSEATVDSTQYIPISHLKYPPLLTICPRQEKTWKNIEDWGWEEVADDYSILTGNSNIY